MIYFGRIIAAAIQFSVILFLASVGAETLGVYSLFAAIGAVAFQLVQFEGHQYAIGDIIPPWDLRAIYRTTNLFWMPFFVFMVVLARAHPQAMVFLASFLFMISADWVVNLRHLEQRIAGQEQGFRRDLLGKVAVVDIALPLVLMGALHLWGARAAPCLAGAVTLAALALLLGFVGLPAGMRALRLPRPSFLHGVIIKRLDSMFIRLFVGFFLGPRALGVIQPLLSMGRILTMLTPTWININFASRLRASGRSRSKMQVFLKIVFLSYLLYGAVAVLIWLFSGWLGHSLQGFGFWQIVLVMLFFGNQNSKALFRSFSIIQSDLNRNNVLISISFLGKLLASYLLLGQGAFGVVLACVLVDALLIVANMLLVMRIR
ncbi:MAG TPA: hypothetical protein ENJ52_11695 [Aliiroseovarius sp.]|nr:hypothetical protein [Aliiroseovarius sp.]